MMIIMIVVMAADYADDFVDNNHLYDANDVRVEYNCQWTDGANNYLDS